LYSLKMFWKNQSFVLVTKSSLRISFKNITGYKTSQILRFTHLSIFL
jgi:hypothetical protein